MLRKLQRAVFVRCPYLILRWKKLRVSFIGQVKRYRQREAFLFLALAVVVNAPSKVYLSVSGRIR